MRSLGLGDRMHFRRWKRREFITLLGGAAAWPMAARAQQGIVPSVGVLHEGSPGAEASVLYAGLLRGLAETGFVEGWNLGIDQRFAEGHVERLPALAGDLVLRNPAVIATLGTNAALAARRPAGRPQSFLTLGATRSRLASLQASIVPAAILRVSPLSGRRSLPSAWICCTAWCQQRI